MVFWPGDTETAFPLREKHYEFTFDGVWEDDGQERHVQWVKWLNIKKRAAESIKIEYNW